MQQYVREIEEKYRNILWLTKDNEGQHLTQSNGSNGQEDYTSEHKYNLRVSHSTTNLGTFEDKFFKKQTVTTEIVIPRKTVIRLEIKSEDILDKIAIDMCPEKTGNYKMLYMRKIGTPMIFRKR